jgi:hypothetical protein
MRFRKRLLISPAVAGGDRFNLVWLENGKRTVLGGGWPGPLRDKVDEVLAGKELTAEQRRVLQLFADAAAWYCWNYQLLESLGKF